MGAQPLVWRPAKPFRDEASIVLLGVLVLAQDRAYRFVELTVGEAGIRPTEALTQRGQLQGSKARHRFIVAQRAARLHPGPSR